MREVLTLSDKFKVRTKSKFNIKDWFRFTEKGAHMDMPMLIITLILLAFGLVMLYSASYVYGIYRFKGDALHYIKDQALFAVIGLAAMFTASKVDYHVFRRWAIGLLGFVYILLVIVLFMPEFSLNIRFVLLMRGESSVA